MKIVGIAGSLRAKSNTMHYVKNALNEFKNKGIETELISLRGKEIKPCNGCYDCVKKGYCTIKGDDFDEILGKMRDAEGIDSWLSGISEFSGASDDVPSGASHICGLLE